MTGSCSRKRQRKALKALRSVQPANALNSNKNWIEWAKLVTTTASKHKSGNCGELGLVAAYELYQKGTRDVDYAMIEDGFSANPVVLHAFAVIGRTNGSNTDGDDIGLPDSWGDAALVCDPWDRAAYPGAQYASFWDGLKDASGSPDDLTCTLLHRFT